MVFEQNFIRIILISVWLQGCASGNGSPGHDSPEAVPTPPGITTLDTGYLEATPGYTGSVLGAEVIGVSDLSAEELQIIEVSIPVDPDQVDEVRIISPSGSTLKQQRQAEILRDYENNNVGIKLYLPQQQKWGFKLKLIDKPEDN